jgi:hypothetical protein
MQEEHTVNTDEAAEKAPTTRNVTVVAITPEFNDQIKSYLEGRPAGEVFGLLSVLKQLQPFELAIPA